MRRWRCRCKPGLHPFYVAQLRHRIIWIISGSSAFPFPPPPPPEFSPLRSRCVIRVRGSLIIPIRCFLNAKRRTVRSTWDARYSVSRRVRIVTCFSFLFFSSPAVSFFFSPGWHIYPSAENKLRGRAECVARSWTEKCCHIHVETCHFAYIYIYMERLLQNPRFEFKSR